MILLDLNVVLDVVQRREPHFRASAAVVDGAITGRVAACLPAHAFTTLHYLIARYRDATTADATVGWLLENFVVAGVTRTELLRARQLDWPDFEDAVVVAAAEAAACQCIVSRNVRDFRGAPLPVLTPEEYLLDPGIPDHPPPQVE